MTGTVLFFFFDDRVECYRQMICDESLDVTSNRNALYCNRVREPSIYFDVSTNSIVPTAAWLSFYNTR